MQESRTGKMARVPRSARTDSISKARLADRLRLALQNRRFRSVLTILATSALGIEYLWATFLRPIVARGNSPVDFFEDYVGSAKLMVAGIDPYSACLSHACWTDLANAWSLYPPVVTWLSQPLVGLDHTVTGIGALVGAQLCVGAFVWIVVRKLRVNDWQVMAICALSVITFPPLIGEVVNRNLEVLLLALSAVWFAGWLEGDRWWAGFALGTGIALKLAQAPTFLFGLWFGRAWTSVVAALSVAALWLVGAPQYLPEYLTRIVPGLNTGTGFAMDVAPTGAVARLLHPASMFGQGTGIDPVVRGIGYAIAAVVVIVSIVWLRGPARDRDRRALEAATVIAATPLIVAVVRPGHLILLLLPMLVLAAHGVRVRDPWLGAAVVASWLLIGPIYLWFSQLLAAGIGAQFVRPGAESALLGAVVLWLGALRALRQWRSAGDSGQAVATA